MSTSPFEILIAQFEMYLAPVGESYPDLDEAPAGNWVKLGTNGKRDMGEEGVTVQHPQSLTPIRAYGATGPVKMARDSEDLIFAAVLLDITVEEYTRIFNNVTVVDTAAGSGTPGIREIDLKYGLTPYEVAFLLKADQSPYGDGWSTQYEIPKVVQSGSPTVVYVKNDAARLAIEFTAIEDPDAASDSARFGRLVQQDATAV